MFPSTIGASRIASITAGSFGDLVGRKRILIAGIGGESARITIRRAKDANAAGADAVLVVSPHYYTSSMTPDALRAHHKAEMEKWSAIIKAANIKVE